MVARRCYDRADERIAGYGSMAEVMDNFGAAVDGPPETVYEVTDFPDCNGYVTRNKVNMRAAPESNGERLLKDLQKGTPVAVKARVFIHDEWWYQVEYEDRLGYIRHDLLNVDFAAVVSEVDGCGCYDAQSGAWTCEDGCACPCHGMLLSVEEDEDF